MVAHSPSTPLPLLSVKSRVILGTQAIPEYSCMPSINNPNLHSHKRGNLKISGGLKCKISKSSEMRTPLIGNPSMHTDVQLNRCEVIIFKYADRLNGALHAKFPKSVKSQNQPVLKFSAQSVEVTIFVYLLTHKPLSGTQMRIFKDVSISFPMQIQNNIH